MLRVAFLIHCILTLSVAQPEFENIDTLQPVMRSSPEMGQFAGDLFGYTAVLHKTQENGGPADTSIVVSAPYGQAMAEGGGIVPLQRSGNFLATGVIYTCPVTPGPCDGLRGDNVGEDRRLYDVDDNIRISEISDRNFGEEKRGQFLGATLKSTGDTFLACAHRRLDFGAGLDRNPYGVCYHSGRSLRGFSRYEPCSRSSRSFFGHGQCQAGTSGDIIQGNILVGAPGTFAWRGAVFRRSSSGARSFSSNGVGSGSISWQGYEVVTGRINSAQEDFIVSVPRFNNYIGRVNIYANTGELRPVGNPPLAGDQIGAYYGFSMAAVDLQGRGMDDLLISAPMYSPEVNSPEFGRVYVYRNNQGSLSFFTRLEGRIRYGRFGHAMAKLGDINGDSFEDVAISAPFGDGPGTVYIYAGAGSSVINQNPIQTIVGSNLNLQASQLMGLRSFGSSLSSNVDVDNNGYNDLVIGAFQSQRVFMLRTRPVARLEVRLNSDSAVDLRIMPAGCSMRPCFNISACMQYGGRGLQGTLDINYTLEVDPQLIRQGLTSRVNLRNENSPGSITGSLMLTQDESMCVNTTAIVKEQIDISSPFTVQFTPTLVQNRVADPNWNGNMALTTLEAVPLLAVVGETSALTQYVTACGNNSVCQPDLNVTVMMENVTYENEDGVVIPGANSITSGITTAMEIPVLVVNNGDDAFGARISVTFDNVLTLSRVVPPIMGNMPRIPFSCTDRDVNTNSVSCAIANEFLENETSIIIFRFQTNAVTGTEMMLQTVFNVTSQPSENATTSEDNTAVFNIDVTTNIDLRLQLSLTQESIVLGETNPSRSISDVAQFAPPSSIFDAIFSITNLGSTRVPFARLTIFWPLNAPVAENCDGDCRRFYLYPIRTDDGLSCETEFINTQNHELDQLGEASTQSPGSKRRRRQAAEVANVTEVSCIDGVGASCVGIICNITDISRTARVSIQAIPDNRQFFGNRQNFEFTIHAMVRIVGNFDDRDNTNNEDMASLVGITAIAPPSSQDDEIAAWVIIVPIVIGVLIIIIIVIALYFLGFFKLKKVDKEKDEEELNQDGDAPDGDKQPEASEL